MSRKTVMKCVGLGLVAAVLWTGVVEAQQSTAVQSRRAVEGVTLAQGHAAQLQAPAPWLQEDPGSRAYAAARELLNAGQYRDAANAFYQLRAQYAESGYVAASYYYQAFALSRLGSRADLRQARELLETELHEHPEASSLADARELLVRVESELAQQGDRRAAASITQQAQEACGPEQELRAAALNALLNMNPERAVPILRQVLEDRDACSAELREQAVFLLSQKMDEESVDILLDLAHRNPDPDPGVREQAVFWLSQVHSDEALDALHSILRESEDQDIQENALFAISNHESQRSGEILREYVEREDVPTELRESALFWIGQTPDGPEYLMGLWGSLHEVELRENILHAVAQHGAEGSQDWLVDRAMDSSEAMEVRESALFWAGQSGGFSIEDLRELMAAFEDPELKEAVLFAASQRDGTEAVDFLMEVAEDPENGELREMAIFWLGQSDDPRVPEFLLRIIGR